MQQPFQTCTRCGASWQTRDRFLRDPGLEIIEYRVNFDDITAGRFAFRHALTREAIYADMLSRERRALHRSIAEILVRQHVDDEGPLLADLALHFAEAEVWTEALHYGELAGLRALELLAPHAAVEHLNRAFFAAERLRIEPSMRLLATRGRALSTIGDFEGARSDFEALLDLSYMNTLKTCHDTSCLLKWLGI